VQLVLMVTLALQVQPVRLVRQVSPLPR